MHPSNVWNKQKWCFRLVGVHFLRIWGVMLEHQFSIRKWTPKPSKTDAKQCQERVRIACQLPLQSRGGFWTAFHCKHESKRVQHGFPWCSQGAFKACIICMEHRHFRSPGFRGRLWEFWETFWRACGPYFEFSESFLGSFWVISKRDSPWGSWRIRRHTSFKQSTTMFNSHPRAGPGILTE